MWLAWAWASISASVSSGKLIVLKPWAKTGDVEEDEEDDGAEDEEDDGAEDGAEDEAEEE